MEGRKPPSLPSSPDRRSSSLKRPKQGTTAPSDESSESSISTGALEQRLESEVPSPVHGEQLINIDNDDSSSDESEFPPSAPARDQDP